MNARTADQIPPRHEYKYVLPQAQIAHVRKNASAICELDAFCQKSPNHRYTITSLYLDSPTLAFHFLKKDRARTRFKLRIRTYAGSDLVFWEVKRKIGEIIRKTRGRLDHKRWVEQILDPVPNPAPDFADFLALRQRHQAQPTLLARYSREAWISPIDDYARITFDAKLEYAATDAWVLDAPASAWRPEDDPPSLGLQSSGEILELKFPEAAPRWMVQIAKGLNLHRVGYSKYCTGIEHMIIRDPTFFPRARTSTLAGHQ